MITKFRRLIQWSIFLGIILITVLNYYENQKVKYGGELVIQESPILRTVDKIFGQLENRTKIVTFLQGDVWSFQIGSIKITDPLAFIGNISRTKAIYWPLFLAALIPIILTILLGKVFCSWICPMGLLFELNAKLRTVLQKFALPLGNFTLPPWCKYIVLGGGIFTGLVWGAHYFFLIYPPKIISGEIYFSVIKSSLGYGVAFLFLLLAIELFLAPRFWCRSLCPGGALYTLLSQFRFLRIKNDLNRCTNCGICDTLCPYDITPSKGKLSLECDHCSLCITKCPVKSLSFKMPNRTHTPGVCIWLILTMCLFFNATTASAHHIRGLPHYGYSENYPQTPTYEEIRVVDDWKVNFSYIKIFETKNCDLAVYLKNTKTGKPYAGKIRFKVFGEREDPEASPYYDTHFDPTNTFRVGWAYELDGVYIVRAQFFDEGKEYIEDFRMQIGKVGFNPLWWAIPGIFVLILIILIAVKQRRSSK